MRLILLMLMMPFTAASVQALESPGAIPYSAPGDSEVAWHLACRPLADPYGLACGEGPCGIVEAPDCWTWRWFCWLGKGPLEARLNGTVYCEQQPGCCVGVDGSTCCASAEADAAGACCLACCSLAFVGANCQNYGVQVIVTTSQVCSGEDCSNYGVRVILGNSYCDLGPVSLCIQGKCLAPVECPPYAVAKYCWARPTSGPTEPYDSGPSGAA